MADFKYIVLKTKLMEYPVIFPALMVHDLVADALLGMEDMQAQNAKVISAGFLYITGERILVTGEGSETLNIVSRGKQDEDLIRNFWLTKGIK